MVFLDYIPGFEYIIRIIIGHWYNMQMFKMRFLYVIHSAPVNC